MLAAWVFHLRHPTSDVRYLRPRLGYRSGTRIDAENSRDLRPCLCVAVFVIPVLFGQPKECAFAFSRRKSDFLVRVIPEEHEIFTQYIVTIPVPHFLTVNLLREMILAGIFIVVFREVIQRAEYLAPSIGQCDSLILFALHAEKLIPTVVCAYEPRLQEDIELLNVPVRRSALFPWSVFVLRFSSHVILLRPFDSRRFLYPFLASAGAPR
jgi:hypothetical protein